MKHPCPEWIESIDLHAAGWLSPAEEAALRAHLEACPACRAAHDAVLALSLDLKAAAPALRSPRLRPEGVPARRIGWLAAAAAAVLLVVLRPAREPASVPAPVATRDSASIPTWLACNQALAEEGALESLLDRHAARVSLGRPTPVLLALCTDSTLEEIR